MSFGASEISTGLNYINGDAEFSAMFAVPAVIKRGLDISSHVNNHKGRGFDTVTFAAPVKIGAQMA